MEMNEAPTDVDRYGTAALSGAALDTHVSKKVKSCWVVCTNLIRYQLCCRCIDPDHDPWLLPVTPRVCTANKCVRCRIYTERGMEGLGNTKKYTCTAVD